MPTTATTFNGNQIIPFYPDEAKTMSIRIAASKTIAAGTLMAQNSSTGKWEAYSSGGSNGLNVARAILQFDIVSDSNGLCVMGDQATSEYGQKMANVPAFYCGTFRKGDLVGLDSTGVTGLGARYITGGPTAADDLLRIP
jgi:hypothetical protein